MNKAYIIKKLRKVAIYMKMMNKQNIRIKGGESQAKSAPGMQEHYRHREFQQ